MKECLTNQMLNLDKSILEIKKDIHKKVIEKNARELIKVLDTWEMLEKKRIEVEKQYFLKIILSCWIKLDD